MRRSSGVRAQSHELAPGHPDLRRRGLPTRPVDGDVRCDRVPASAHSAPRPGLHPDDVRGGDEFPVDRACAPADDDAGARGASPAKEPFMARVSTYLNFQGQAEEAFAFYAKTFGTEVTMLSRFSDMPPPGPANCPPKSGPRDAPELPITGGHVLMATTCSGRWVANRIGNNTTLCLDVDSRDRPTACTAPYPRAARKDPDGRHAVGVLFGRHPGPLRHPLDVQPQPGILNDRQPRRLRESVAATPARGGAPRLPVPALPPGLRRRSPQPRRSPGSGSWPRRRSSPRVAGSHRLIPSAGGRTVL